MQQMTAENALILLQNDADRIKQLIQNQQNKLCISHCKAFEEVIDTQMYGLSREVDFAVRLGIVSHKTGQQLLSDLERDLNRLYNDVYQEQQTVKIEQGAEHGAEN